MTTELQAATPTEDAVKALAFAMCHDRNENGGDSIHEDFLWIASGVIKHLAAQGYTLCRETTAPDGVAKQPEAQSAPAMTEAELEREALELAKDMFEWTDSANASFIVGLVKKYAGRV